MYEVQHSSESILIGVRHTGDIDILLTNITEDKAKEEIKKFKKPIYHKFLIINEIPHNTNKS
jgi:hypothetical protein